MKKRVLIAATAILSITGGLLGKFLLEDDYTCVPLTYGKARCPIAPVKINGNTYPLELDLGSVNFLVLDHNILQHTEKMSYGFTAWRDLKGNTYQSARYLIPEIQIGSISMSEVLADEQQDSFFLETSLVEGMSHRPLGSIGRPLLKRINLFLDFPHSQLILTNSTARLKKEGNPIETMVCVPFRLTRAGLVLSIETDLGTKNFMLDTGSTLTLVRSSLINHLNLQEKEEGLQAFSSSQFKMGGHDFGSQDLYCFNLADELTEVDGVLGMDFMRTRQLYIDYPKQIIYVGNASATQ